MKNLLFVASSFLHSHPRFSNNLSSFQSKAIPIHMKIPGVTRLFLRCLFSSESVSLFHSIGFLNVNSSGGLEKPYLTIIQEMYWKGGILYGKWGEPGLISLRIH